MRILFATRYSSRVAGAETYVATVIPALAARGHQIAVLAELAPSPSRELLSGPFPIWCAQADGEAQALGHAREWKPDVVYVHGLQSLELERALLAIAPAVLFAHSYVGLCISGSRTWQKTNTPCTRSLGPGCLVKYFPSRCGGRSPVTMWQDYRRQRARHDLHRRYAAIIVASWHMAATFAPAGINRRVHVMPVPVPAPVANAPRERGTPIKMVFAGRLERLKGVQFVVEAAAEACAQLGIAGQLRVIGDGPMRVAIEEGARSHQSDRLQVSVQGWQNDQRRDAVLADADVLLVPSVWPEPFGLIGLEAARFGVPAAAFSSGGIPEWLRDGVNGTLAIEPSVRGLADAIVRCAGDPQTYRQLSQGALAAAQAVSPAAHAIALERVLKEATQ